MFVYAGCKVNAEYLVCLSLLPSFAYGGPSTWHCISGPSLGPEKHGRISSTAHIWMHIHALLVLFQPIFLRLSALFFLVSFTLVIIL